MRVFSLLLIAAVLGLLVLGLFLWPTKGDETSTSAGIETAPAKSRGAVEVVAPGEESTGDRRDVVEDPPPARMAEAPEEAGAEPGEEGTGIVVRGTVLFSEDRQPAAGARFMLHHATGYVELVTDAEGRFATGPEIVPGVARPWHMAAGGEGRLARRLHFGPERFAVPADAGEVEVELLLLTPDHHVLVEVTHTGGEPAVGALVRFDRWSEDATDLPSHASTANETDAAGRTSFPVYDAETLTSAALVARSREDLVSEAVALAPPLSVEPVRLVVDVGGRITARVLDGSGAPVRGQWLWIGRGGGPTPVVDAGAQTDEAGEAVFAPLAPGEYTVRFVSRRGGGEVVDVRRGEAYEVELRLPLEVTARAAAGTVVDEEGAPLAGVEIRADFDGSGNAWRQTDEEGRFEFHAAPCAVVRLTSDENEYGDEYEPAVQEVAFGTTGVVFRRTMAYPRATLSLEVVDAATGERIEGVMVLSYRAPNLGSYRFHRGEGGLVGIDLSHHPGFRVAVGAPGYRRRHIETRPLLDANFDGTLHRVELDRGLSRTVQVFADTDEEAPLAGARCLWAGKVIGRSDAGGLMKIDLYQSVDELVFEADGHGATTCDPSAWLSDLEPPWIWLTPDADDG